MRHVRRRSSMVFNVDPIVDVDDEAYVYAPPSADTRANHLRRRRSLRVSGSYRRPFLAMVRARNVRVAVRVLIPVL